MQDVACADFLVEFVFELIQGDRAISFRGFHLNWTHSVFHGCMLVRFGYQEIDFHTIVGVLSVVARVKEEAMPAGAQ